MLVLCVRVRFLDLFNEIFSLYSSIKPLLFIFTRNSLPRLPSFSGQIHSLQLFAQKTINPQPQPCSPATPAAGRPLAPAGSRAGRWGHGTAQHGTARLPGTILRCGEGADGSRRAGLGVLCRRRGSPGRLTRKARPIYHGAKLGFERKTAPVPQGVQAPEHRNARHSTLSAGRSWGRRSEAAPSSRRCRPPLAAGTPRVLGGGGARRGRAMLCSRLGAGRGSRAAIALIYVKSLQLKRFVPRGASFRRYTLGKPGWAPPALAPTSN